MAVIANQFLTLSDWASRLDPDGKIGDVTNLLSQTNEILDDMLWTEGNLPTGHQSVIRTGLPTPAWRQLYSGVPRTKSTTAKVVDSVGMLADYSYVDQDLARLSGDVASFRMTEDSAHLEGMSQTMASTLFYGDATANPERFNGLGVRFSTKNKTKAQNAVNVVDAGGTGPNLTSMWLVCWGPQTCFGIFPKGSKAGLEMEDVTTAAPVLDGNGNPYQAYQTRFGWNAGLVVRDWRYVVRVVNIDTDALAADGGSQANLLKLLTQAVYQVPTMPRSVAPVQSATDAKGGIPLSFGRPAIYVNRSVSTALDIQSQEKINVRLKYDEVNGVPALKFRGIPIRTVDAISNSEAKVS